MTTAALVIGIPALLIFGAVSWFLWTQSPEIQEREFGEYDAK